MMGKSCFAHSRRIILKKGGVDFYPPESNDRISTLAPGRKESSWTVSGYLKRGRMRGQEKRNRSGRSRLADQLRIRSYPCLVQGDFRCQRRTAAKRRYFPDLFFLFARGCGNLAGGRSRIISPKYQDWQNWLKEEL